MTSLPKTLSSLVALLILSPAALAEQPSPDRVRQLIEEASPSLVIIKYTWQGEVDRRELEGVGMVVSEDGLVMAPLDVVPVVLPDAQVRDFQILIPRADGDPREIRATLQGRDERSSVVFIKADPENSEEDPVDWQPVQWTYEKPEVGEWVISIGRLPEGAGYGSYTYVSRISTHLRGPVPLSVVDVGLAGTGAVVLNSDGRAVGLVQRIGQRSPFLTGADALQMLEDRPTIFVPAEFFDLSLEDPPSADEPLRIPYLGAERLTGVPKDLREHYGLGDRPAVQVGDIVEDSPAARAGVRAGDVIIQLNGEPLERGDTAEEVPQILNRTIARLPVDEEITLTLMDAAREEREVTVRLEERPMQPRQAERWFAQDLGFSVRELVFVDRYVRRLPREEPGVAVAYVREQSNAAAAGVRNGDLIRKLNQIDVEGLDDFREAYEEFRRENPRDPVVLEVLRGSETQIIRIEAPR